MSESRPEARPRCPKCRGPLIPELELNGRVAVVKCILCGNRIDRDHPRRLADEKESNIRIAPHKPSKRDRGPARSNYQAGIHRGMER
jgi:hypothetical protein